MQHLNEEIFRFNDHEKLLFQNFRTDFKSTKKSKTEIDKLITEWNNIYEGKVSKNIPANRSKLVMKETAKQIEWQKPNITEPFVSTQNPIRITGPQQNRARIMQKYGNMQFTGEFDRVSFMDQVTDVLLREGTVWTKTSWLREEEPTVEKYSEITMQRIIEIGEEPTKIEQVGENSFNVEFANSVTKVNKGDTVVLRNENVFPDPSARTRSEMGFIMVRRYETVDSLRSTGLYDDRVLDKLNGMTEQNTDSSLASQRNKDDEFYGYDSAYRKANEKKIAIIEYWGLADLKNDKRPVQVMAEWAEKEECNLRLEANFMPENDIPFDVAVYSSRPFSMWGNALAFFIGDSQAIKSGLMRGIMDNMSNANNGQTFAMRGAMDYVNFKRWRNGDRHIIMNKHPSEALHEGNFNNLPPSVFNVVQMVDSEIEKLSGVQAGGPALANSQMAKDDTGGEQLTMAQQRMASTVRNVSNLISKIIKKWIVMAEHWLDDEQIEMMFTESEQIDINAFRDSGKTQVKLKVGTEVTRNAQIHQLNMLLQQSKTLEGAMPPNQLNKLVAEMYELFDQYDEAEALRTYTKPEPSEQELLIQNLGTEKLGLENAKIQAEINELNSRAEDNKANAFATIQYKGAQTEEKKAKAQSHKVDTALKPVQAMTEIQNSAKQTQGE